MSYCRRARSTFKASHCCSWRFSGVPIARSLMVWVLALNVGNAQAAPPAPNGPNVSAPHSSSELQTSIDQLQSDLKAARVAGDKKKEAECLTGLGRIYSGMGEKKQALDYYNQALIVNRALGDRAGEASSLNTVGGLYEDMGDWRKALDCFNPALAIRQSVGDRAGEAATLNNIGVVNYGLGEMQKAMDYFSRALEIRHAVGDRSGEATTLGNIGNVHADQGELPKALDFYNRALLIQRALGNRTSEASTLSNIGTVYEELGDRQNALDLYNQALMIDHETGNRAGEAAALGNTGTIYLKTGETRKAVDTLNEALVIFRELGDRADEARTLNAIGLTYSYLGEMQKALAAYDETLTICREVGDRADEARTLGNMGIIYDNLGEGQKALDYYQQALAGYRGLGDRDGEAGTLNNIGIIYDNQHEKQKALDSYNQGLAIFRAVGDRAGEAVMLDSIGVAHFGLGEDHKALDSYKQALIIQRGVGDQRGQALALYNIANVYAKLGQKQKALDRYTSALLSAAAQSDPLLQAEIFDGLFKVERQTHVSLAIFYGKQSINLLQHIRGNIQDLNDELRKSFLASKDSYYHDLADLLIVQNRLPEAQQVLEMMKASEFEQFTRSSRRVSNQPPTLTAQEQAVENAYQESSRKLFQIAGAESALEKKTNPTEEDRATLANLRNELTAANRAFSNLLASLPSMLPDRGQAQKAEDMAQNISGLKDLMRNIADPGTVALYTLVTDHYYRVIVICSDGRMVERHSAIPIKTLRQHIARFRELLSTKPGAGDGPGDTPRTTAQTAEMMALAGTLYSVLISPIAGDLDASHARTLVWELDDALHYIPLGALYNPETKHFLVQNYATVITTPKDQQKSHAPPNLDGAQVLAMGLSRSGYDQHFGKLPNVPAELAAIVRDPQTGAHGVLPGSEWLDLSFTEARLIDELKGANSSQHRTQPYKIVHIASHFNADPAGDYLRSFLLLAGQNTALDQNGFGFHLTLDDLANEETLQEIFAGVDLLTLSACETAITVQRGDGHEIDGLGGVAQERGADAVMASLWNVYDSSTAQLMVHFYELWTDPAAKRSKAEALRLAELEMLGETSATPDAASAQGADATSASFSDPYYWAPFILMGNWK